MLTEKLKLILSIAIDLIKSIAMTPLSLLNIDGSKNASIKLKSREQHKLDIENIAKALMLAKIYDPNVKIVISRKLGDGHSTRLPHYKKGKYRIDISALTSILQINLLEKYADVEALVTFEDLCKATLKHGLLPAVVPELKSITIGGSIQGYGIESTSWMYSTVDQNVIQATLITGHGNIISSLDAPDLWKSVPGSCGSLALVVAARIRLVDATEWMRIRYVRYSDTSQFLNDLENRFKNNHNYGWQGNDQVMEAIKFCKADQGAKGLVAIYGGCVSSIDESLSIYRDSAYSKFFYQHVQSILGQYKVDNDEPYHVLHEEYMPTLDYLFRHDRGAFWTIELMRSFSPTLWKILELPVLLIFFQNFLKTDTIKKLAMLLYDEEVENIIMIQDVDVPLRNAKEIIEWGEAMNLQRLWICPVLSNKDCSLFGTRHNERQMVVNIGLYGTASNLPQANLTLQRLASKLDGKVGLYAYIYADRDEFWSWYDYQEYNQLRERWGGDVFMDVWEKTVHHSIFQSSFS